jgi:SNF2 family DNA or RNA helicase
MSDWKLLLKPRKHQADIFERTKDEGSWAFFMDMGTGKTACGLASAMHWFLTGRIDRLLVLAPNGVHYNWLPEMKKCWDFGLVGADVLLWPRDRKKILAGQFSGQLVMLMNIEALSSSEAAQKAALDFVSAGRSGLIVDESTTIKNSKSIRHKKVAVLSKKCKVVRILTGSPVTDSPLDVFGQISVLNLPPALFPYPSIVQFKNKYAIIQQRTFGFRSFKQVVGYKNLDVLNETLRKFSSRVQKNECLDLPDKIYVTRKFFMSPEQEDIYRQLAKEGIFEFESGNMVAPQLAMSLLSKLMQVCSGFVITETEDGEALTKQFPNGRMAALLSTIEEMNGQVVIWSCFRQSIMDIVRTLEEEYGPGCVAQYWGGVKDEERLLGLQEFQAGKRRFFVANPQSAGYGLTLVNCSNVIYYNNGFSLEQRLQSEDRCHRIGQVNKVLYVDLVCENTVDVKVLKALLSKQDISAKTIGEEPREWFAFE